MGILQIVEVTVGAFPRHRCRHGTKMSKLISWLGNSTFTTYIVLDNFFLLLTRVYLSFTVHKLEQFSSNPGKVSFKGLSNLSRNIRNNWTLGLKYYSDMKYALYLTCWNNLILRLKISWWFYLLLVGKIVQTLEEVQDHTYIWSKWANLPCHTCFTTSFLIKCRKLVFYSMHFRNGFSKFQDVNSWLVE